MRSNEYTLDTQYNLLFDELNNIVNSAKKGDIDISQYNIDKYYDNLKEMNSEKFRLHNLYIELIEERVSLKERTKILCKKLPYYDREDQEPCNFKVNRSKVRDLPEDDEQ